MRILSIKESKRMFFNKRVSVIFAALMLSVLGTGKVSAMDISVRLFSSDSYQKMRFATELGMYRLLDENNHLITELGVGEFVHLEWSKESVQVVKNKISLGKFKKLSFEGDGNKAIFSLMPESYEDLIRYYDDHLEVWSEEKNRLCMVNVVDLENYVAGVVQSETRGISEDVNFYKVQAIISRTYALSNIAKHRKESYNLCDNVHCQVYKSRNNVPIILTATVETASQVVVDKNNKVITAAFSSNSGGMTANAKDVWKVSVPYLVSVKDTFSLASPRVDWQLTMSEREWLSFLETQYDYPIRNRVMRDSALNFTQTERLVYFPNQIPLRSIRADLGLRSTFFSVSTLGNQVVLNGKGYGHGVGLSQEGAVRMIELGYSVEEVLKFYYTGTSVISMEDLSSGEYGD